MNSEIRQKLDQVTDKMFSGGLANPITYVEQLSYLIYLKLLDEAENQHSQAELLGITLDRPTLFPSQAKRFRWSEWCFRSGEDLLDFLGSLGDLHGGDWLKNQNCAKRSARGFLALTQAPVIRLLYVSFFLLTLSPQIYRSCSSIKSQDAEFR